MACLSVLSLSPVDGDQFVNQPLKSNWELNLSLIFWCVLSHFSHVRLFGNPWAVACQAPLSMAFSRQEHWNGLWCRPLLYPGVESTSFTSPALAGRFFTSSTTWEALFPDGSVQYADDPQKWTTEALLQQSRMVLKDNASGKSSQWAELQAAQLVIHFAWKGRWPEMWLFQAYGLWLCK